jgi:hypothetical protein
MNCSNCGAPVPSPAPGSGSTPCPFCHAPIDAPPKPDVRQQLAAALLADRNGNGIPDVLEALGAVAGAGAATPGAYRAPAPPVQLDAIPPAPRAPSPRAKSLVFGYRGAQGVKLLVGLIFLAVGTLMSSIFCWGLPLDVALATMGTAAQATVIGTETVSNVEVNGAHPTRIRFRYRAGGQTYEGDSSTLDSSIRRTARAGEPVGIDVLGFAPGVARVTGTTLSTMGYAGVFVLIFPTVGAVFAFGAWRSNRREIQAFTHGRPIAARVTYAGADMSVTVNGSHPLKVEWQFEIDGKSYTGAISSMSAADLGGLVNAKDVAVLYDPRDPKVNTVWVA